MNVKLRILTRTAVMLAAAVMFQWLGKLTGDALTLGVGTTVLIGSLVNLVLLLSVTYCGLAGALTVGFLTPAMALVIGQLPSPLLIPFVGAANAVLVLSFYFLQKSKQCPKFISRLAGIALGAVLKFLFMRFAIVSILPLLGLAKLVNALTVSYGVVQLFAALIGGMLYFSVAAGLDRAKIDSAVTLMASVCHPDAQSVTATEITDGAD